jgi:di/tricarboxylate transporter
MQYLPPASVLAAVLLFVTVLTKFASNTLATAVGAQIAFGERSSSACQSNRWC